MTRLWSRLREMPRRIHRLPLKPSPQMRLLAVVLVAAVASAIYAAANGRQWSLGRLQAGASSPVTDAAAEPDISSKAARQAQVDQAQAALARPIEIAFEAARKGDLEDYLAQFADPLRPTLEHMRTQQGDAYLRAYLTRITRVIKGVAVDLTHQETAGPDAMRLQVELTYSDHNERQPFVLRHEGARWRISRIEMLRSAPTLIPYGTPLEQVR